MKLIILSLIISISLHLLIINDYEFKKKQEGQQKSIKKSKKSTITFAKIKKEKKIVKKEITKRTKAIKTKPIINKPIINKNIKKPFKKLIKAPKKIIYAKKRPTKIPNKKKIEALKNRTLEDFLLQADPIDQKILDDIQKLYGKEFETFTKIQKAYIKENFNSFQQVTQRVLTRLGYPRLAAQLRISGVNVVEFLFHPNGDISKLRIINSSGYEIFDKYTIKLIEIAYKDYPRPESTTKLRFNVRYMLY